MKKSFVKSTIMKDFILKAWTDLRIARKGIIAREVARAIQESKYSAEQKILLFEKIGNVGFYLKELSKAGYGHNSSSKVIKDKNGKIAGELCTQNIKAVWIFDNVGVK